MRSWGDGRGVRARWDGWGAGDSGRGARRPEAAAEAAEAAETVVSQAWPDGARPRMVRGTISTEPSDAGSKVKLPNATGPVPGSPTWLSDTVRSNRSRSHFSPAVKRSSPAGSVIRAASPQPTSPQPRRTHARGDAGGTWASRSPGSSMGTVRTTRLPGSGAACPGTGAGRGSPGATSFPSALIATDFTGSQCNPTDSPVVSRVCRLSPWWPSGAWPIGAGRGPAGRAIPVIDPDEPGGAGSVTRG